MSVNGNEESTGENCHTFVIHFSCKCNYSILLHNKTPIYSAWGLLRVCVACPPPHLKQSYKLRPPWEQHLRYVPHWARNGYNKAKQMSKVKNGRKRLFREGVMSVQLLERIGTTLNKRQETGMQDKKQANSI